MFVMLAQDGQEPQSYLQETILGIPLSYRQGIILIFIAYP